MLRMSESINRVADEDGGFALVAVLLFLLLVAAIVTPFAVAARTNLLVVANRGQQDRLNELADAVLTMVAIRQFSAAGGTQVFPLNSTPVACDVSGYSVTAELQDQIGLIDLNAADSTTLATGIESLGMPLEQATAIADAIVDYRSYEPQTTKQGASIQILGGTKHGPFEAVIELSDFRPLQDIPPADLYRTFTVHSRKGVVNLSQAPRRLAVILKGAATSEDSATRSAPMAIRTTVEMAGPAFRGYSGYLIMPSREGDGQFRLVERLIAPDAVASGAPLPCPAPFMDDLAMLLAAAKP
jgi:general secretion pathway protein K